MRIHKLFQNETRSNQNETRSGQNGTRSNQNGTTIPESTTESTSENTAEVWRRHKRCCSHPPTRFHKIRERYSPTHQVGTLAPFFRLWGQAKLPEKSSKNRLQIHQGERKLTTYINDPVLNVLVPRRRRILQLSQKVLTNDLPGDSIFLEK